MFLPLKLLLPYRAAWDKQRRAGNCAAAGHGISPEVLPQFTARFPWLSQRGYAITCLLIPTGKLDPLVARLMGATTATLVGEGADCRFLGGNAGGGLQDTTGIDGSITLPAKTLLEAS